MHLMEEKVFKVVTLVIEADLIIFVRVRKMEELILVEVKVIFTQEVVIFLNIIKVMADRTTKAEVEQVVTNLSVNCACILDNLLLSP